MIQIVRKAAEEWEVIRVDSPGRGVHEYEIIGRVIRDGTHYRVDLPKWHDTGYEWDRQPRAFLLPKAALKLITDRPTKILQ